jgi:hypothetical protein
MFVKNKMCNNLLIFSTFIRSIALIIKYLFFGKYNYVHMHFKQSFIISFIIIFNSTMIIILDRIYCINEVNILIIQFYHHYYYLILINAQYA